MGRARNTTSAVAVASDQFAGLLGQRRGSGSRPTPNETPLAYERDLVTSELAAWRPTIRYFASHTGARGDWRTPRLMKAPYSKPIHIVPDGDNHPDEFSLRYAKERPQTLCGVTVGAQWRHHFRGDFKEPVNDRAHACKRCARLADPDEHWEAFESRTDLEPVHPRRYAATLAALRDGWVEQVGVEARTRPRETERVVARAAREMLLDELCANATHAVEESLGRIGHRSEIVERRLGLERGTLQDVDIAGWLEREDWAEMLDRMLPDRPKVVGRDHDIWCRWLTEKLVEKGQLAGYGSS